MSPVDVEAVLLRAAVIGVPAALVFRSAWWWLASLFERIEKRLTAPDSPVEALAESVREEPDYPDLDEDTVAEEPTGKHAVVVETGPIPAPSLAELTALPRMAGEIVPFPSGGGDAA